MRRTATAFLALLVVAALASAPATADEPKKAAAKRDNKLIGTWRLVSAKYGGQEYTIPEGTTHLKHVTPAHFMWTIYDKDGKVDSALGGSYTLTGAGYEEMPEYGTADLLQQLKGKAQTFKWKIEGNKWHHDGQLSSGVTIEEVWERVEKK